MLAGLLSAFLFIGRAVWTPNQLREHQSCACGPRSCQRSPYQAACALLPELVWSGLHLEALSMERSAQGVSSGASHLPLSDLDLEKGSWGPIWLAGRGGIRLLWGLNAKYILEQVLSPISKYDCSQHFRTISWPHGNVMGPLCHAAACHLWASPLWSS